jgi:hypothetical protein
LPLSLPDQYVVKPDGSADAEGVQRNFQRLAQLGIDTYTGSLPDKASDGQRIDFVADATNGAVWTLKYRVGSASAYKWEYLGGAALFASSDSAAEDVTSTTFVAPTTKLGITLPLSGDYMIEVGDASWHTVAGAGLYHSYAIGATAALDADAAQTFQAVGSVDTFEHYRPRRKNGLAGGSLVETRVRVSAITGKWRRPWMRVTPIRLG